MTIAARPQWSSNEKTVSTYRKLSIVRSESIRILVYPHGTAMALVSCVQRAYGIMVQRISRTFTWLECKSSPRDVFPTSSLYFFSSMTVCTFSYVREIVCLKFMLDVGSRPETTCLKRFSQSFPIRNTNIFSYTICFKCIIYFKS